MKSNALRAFLLAACVCHVTEFRAKVPEAQPNIVLFLVDDLSYADLSCRGSDIQTPNPDYVATAESVPATRRGPRRQSEMTLTPVPDNSDISD